MSNRRYDLDHLRVIGTAVVFLFHCLQPFNPNDQWHIQNADKSEVVGSVIVLLNIWIMPLFVLLAGSSAYFSLTKRNGLQFLKERFVRIFIPLLLGILLFVSPQVYLERVLKAQFHGTFFDFLPEFFQGIYPTGNFSYHHLWFLAYLLTYSVLGLPLLLFLKKNHEFISEKLSKVASHRLGLFIFALPFVLAQLALFWKFKQTNALVNDWAWHAQLFLSFIFGFLLADNLTVQSGIRKYWRTYFLIAIGLTLIVFFLRQIPTVNGPYPWLWIYLVKGTIYRFCMWAWIISILGFASEYLSNNSRRLSYFSKASYPIYIIHQAVIVGIAFQAVQWKASIFTKFMIIASLSLVLTIVIYEIIKRVPVLRITLGLPAAGHEPHRIKKNLLTL